MSDKIIQPLQTFQASEQIVQSETDDRPVEFDGKRIRRWSSPLGTGAGVGIVAKSLAGPLNATLADPTALGITGGNIAQGTANTNINGLGGLFGNNNAGTSTTVINSNSGSGTIQTGPRIDGLDGDSIQQLQNSAKPNVGQAWKSALKGSWLGAIFSAVFTMISLVPKLIKGHIKFKQVWQNGLAQALMGALSGALAGFVLGLTGLVGVTNPILAVVIGLAVGVTLNLSLQALLKKLGNPHEKLFDILFPERYQLTERGRDYEAAKGKEEDARARDKNGRRKSRFNGLYRISSINKPRTKDDCQRACENVLRRAKDHIEWDNNVSERDIRKLKKETKMLRKYYNKLVAANKIAASKEFERELDKLDGLVVQVGQKRTEQQRTKATDKAKRPKKSQ